MVKELYSDIFKEIDTGNYGIAVHGCNCQKNMGAGLAKAFAQKFPELELADKKFDKPKMGTLSHWFDKTSQTLLINAYTQYWYGKPYGNKGALSSQRFSFDNEQNRLNAIEHIFWTIDNVYQGMNILVPKVGAGLAGGNWENIKQTIVEQTTKNDLTFVYK